MPSAKRRSSTDIDISVRVSDEELDQLQLLIGAQVAQVVVWEDSIVEALDAGNLDVVASDIDIYLAGGARFELYGVLTYSALDADPLADPSDVQLLLTGLAKAGAWLEDVAVDTEDDLVLVVASPESLLYLNAGAWSVDEWEELPG